MQRLWTTLRRARFVTLGRVGMDLYADPIGTPIQQATRFQAAIGGSAGNIAVALARQGCASALLSRVSQDAVGAYCLAELARYGVDCAHVHHSGAEMRTSLAVTETTPRDTQVVLYRNGAADFALDAADGAGVDFTQTAALIVTGTALARDPSRSACWAALRAAQDAGALVVLDIDHRAYSWETADQARAVCAEFARACDIVVGNDDEFGLLAGAYDRGESFARSLTDRALFTVYKRGPKGSLTFTADFAFATGIYPVSALKPMGAGDGFMGGLMAGLAQGLTLNSAVRRGAATAAMIVSGFGCAPASPTRAELDLFMTTTRETRCT